MELMENRTILKNNKKCKDLQKIIRQKICNAKIQHLIKQCIEVEDLEAKYDSFSVYKNIKEAELFQKTFHY